VVLVAGGAVTFLTGLAQANGTGAHGLNRVEEANVRVADDIRIKEKDGAQVITSHITLRPGGHAPWHYHPGPHIVSVRTGTVQVYETDCSFRTYPAGTGFFDPGDTRQTHVHTLRNPSATEPAEVVITDIRTDDLRPTVVADPQPGSCFTWNGS
jgi:quercetin dioxygenase-like cupin family protein